MAWTGHAEPCPHRMSSTKLDGAAQLRLNFSHLKRFAQGWSTLHTTCIPSTRELARIVLHLLVRRFLRLLPSSYKLISSCLAGQMSVQTLLAHHEFSNQLRWLWTDASRSFRAVLGRRLDVGFSV